MPSGEMVEWSITAVLKTAVPRGTGGSNPSLSAINPEIQGLTKSVHENVHESASKQMFWGVFSPENEEARTPIIVYGLLRYCFTNPQSTFFIQLIMGIRLKYNIPVSRTSDM